MRATPPRAAAAATPFSELPPTSAAAPDFNNVRLLIAPSSLDEHGLFARIETPFVGEAGALAEVLELLCFARRRWVWRQHLEDPREADPPGELERRADSVLARPQIESSIT